MFQRLVALLFFTAVLSEPECSKFHYEEQTLNKMFRQEIAMEKLQTDMATTQQQVIELTEEVNKNVRNYAAEMEKLKGPTVAFRSKDLVDLTPSSGETLVFKTTTLNEGLGYDNKSGIFTAPVAGTYTFSVQLCVSGGKIMYNAIVADGVEIKKGLVGDKNWTTCYTTDSVAVLRKDSKVYVKCSSSSSLLITTSIYWNTFSGVLVKS